MILKLLKIKTIPVINLKDTLFFVGMYKVTIIMKGDFLMVRVGNKQFERFADYIKQNREKFEQQLVLLSLKNENADLVEVVNRIMMRQFMNGLENSFMTNISFSRASNVSGMMGLNGTLRSSSIGSKTLLGGGNINNMNSMPLGASRFGRLSGASVPSKAARRLVTEPSKIPLKAPPTSAGAPAVRLLTQEDKRSIAHASSSDAVEPGTPK